MNMEKLLNLIIYYKKARFSNENHWKRFGYKQAEILVSAYGAPLLFKSYDTIVGVIVDGKFYELGKYSRTTSKQVTQFCNIYDLERVLMDRPDDSYANSWYSVKY